MQPDPIRHRAIADNLAARLRCCSLDELRLIDRAIAPIEQRRALHGPLELTPPLSAPCFGQEPIGVALTGLVEDMALEDQERAVLHEQARDEMVGAACTGIAARWCPRCGDCSCGEYPAEMNSPTCPLHASGSPHAEPTVRIGLGDDLGGPIAIPVDSDAPVATYRSAIRVVADDGEAPDEIGGGG